MQTLHPTDCVVWEQLCDLKIITTWNSSGELFFPPLPDRGRRHSTSDRLVGFCGFFSAASCDRAFLSTTRLVEVRSRVSCMKAGGPMTASPQRPMQIVLCQLELLHCSCRGCIKHPFFSCCEVVQRCTAMHDKKQQQMHGICTIMCICFSQRMNLPLSNWQVCQACVCALLEGCHHRACA